MRTFVLPLVFFSLLTVPRAARSADRVAGVIVDQSGQLLPRAFVRVIDASGRDTATAFSDERGAFSLPAPESGCRVEASLVGFATATAPCSFPAPLMLVLAVAPVQERVVVSATRTEALAGQVGASVTTFTADDIARRREPLVADLLQSSPGVMVIGSGTPGSVTSLFVRGGESNYNKVLLDGIPLNEPGGTFYFTNLTTTNLERIEIVRGAQSALFGSDAMSSVVQMFTKRPTTDARPSGVAQFEAGSFDTFRGIASASGRSGRFDYSAGAAYINTANDAPNSDFENTTLSGTLGASLSQTALLRFVGRAELGRSGTPGQTAFGRPDLDAFGQRHDGTVGVTFDQQLTPKVHQRAIYALAASNQVSTDLKEDPPYTPRYGDHIAPFEYSDFLYDTHTSLRRHHLGYQADIRLANDARHGDQLLTALADWDGERATLEDRLAGTASPASRNNAGFALQHQATWRRVSFAIGGRFEHNESFGDAFVPRASISSVLHAADTESALGATTIHAAAGKGIKEPTLLQSFSPSPFFKGNPALKPERSRSVEVGIDQRFAADRARVSFVWFDNDYQDLIALQTIDFTTFEAQYFNIGRSRARGGEFTMDVAATPQLRARFGYTRLNSEVLESTSEFSPLFEAGQPLLRRPKNSGFADVSWSQGRFGATLAGLFIGEYLDGDFSSLEPPLTENPGYTRWDARVSYQFAGKLTGLLSIDNLANANYMDPLGYPALGRAVRAGVRVGF
jgi:vitamin B12 transporter